MTLIQQASQQLKNAHVIVESFSTYQILPENATHILANIASNATAGKPLRVMELNSIAAFMAGIEVISKALPTSQDATKKANTIKVLAAAGIGDDGMVTTACAPIAQLGARNESEHKKYSQLVQSYMNSIDMGTPEGGELAKAAKLLQTQIDQAVRIAARSNAPQNPTARGVSMVQTGL